MERIALFPGSFDPVTTGHLNIIERSVHLFDRIIIGLGTNSTKQSLFTPEERMKFLESSFSHLSNVEVRQYEGLTTDFCRKSGAKYILRGLRSSADFEYERAIAQMNNYLASGIETVFIISGPQFTPVSSTIVREIYRNNGDITQFVPEGMRKYIKGS